MTGRKRLEKWSSLMDQVDDRTTLMRIVTVDG